MTSPELSEPPSRSTPGEAATGPLETGSRPTTLLTGVFALAAAVLVLYAATEWRRLGTFGFPLDDSFIHAQFARNLAAGAGLSYQEGALVAGTTAPLWTALLSVGATLGIAAVPWALALGVGAFLFGVWGTFRLGRELDLAPGLAALAAALFCLTDWMVWAALSGMEIALFVALWLWGMVWHLRERREPSLPSRSIVLFAAAALARPEGMLLLGLALLDREGWAGRRAPGRRFERLGLAALVLVPIALFFLVVGGSPLPTTFSVKAGGSHALWPQLRHLFTALEILFRPQPFMVLLAGGGALALLGRLGGERDRGLLLPLWVVALPVAYATLSPPDRPMIVGNFGRYFFPLLPGVVLLGAVALEPVAARLRGVGRAPLRVGLAGLAVTVLLWPSLRATFVGASRLALNVYNVEQSDVAAGRWIADNLPPDDLVAVQDIGAIKYLAPNPVLDLVGIVNPEIVPFLRGERRGEHPSGLGGLFEFLRRERPRWLVLFPESYGGLGVLREMAPGLEPVHEFRVEPNITMAADRLVVLRAAWPGDGGAAREGARE